MAKGFSKDFLWGSSTNVQQFEGAWSGTNLYSTREGFEKIYGFVHVDKDNGLKRRSSKGFCWNKKIIATNFSNDQVIDGKYLRMPAIITTNIKINEIIMNINKTRALNINMNIIDVKDSMLI